MHPSDLPSEIIYEIASYLCPVDVYIDGWLSPEYVQIDAMGCREFIEDTMIRAWKRYTTDDGEHRIIVWCPFTFEYYPIDDISEVNAPTRQHFLRHFARFDRNWYTESRKGSGRMMIAGLRVRPIALGERVIFDEDVNCLIAVNGDIYEIIGRIDSPAICRGRFKKDCIRERIYRCPDAFS